MTKFKDIVKDCIIGCTANNADEKKMHFNINYYVNSASGKGKKYYLFVYKIEEMEEALYNIVRDNVTKDTDVVIDIITIKFNGDIIPVNKSSYAYSFSYFMQKLL